MKLDYCQPFLQHASNEDVDHLMLGGKYCIIKEKGLLRHMALVEPTGHWINRDWLFPEDRLNQVHNVGDTVVYNPKCSRKEKKYLQLVNSGFVFGSSYEVCRVINDVYVVLKNNETETIPLSVMDVR
jgi:hypothetical protein